MLVTNVKIPCEPWWTSGVDLGRVETNTRFVRIFARLHRYSNTKRVFGCTVNKFEEDSIILSTELLDILAINFNRLSK